MSNMYDILGKLKTVIGLDAKPIEQSEKPVYESVEAKGDIMEAVRSLEEKYVGFKKLDEAAKPDFLDVDKDGNKAEPFKKAVKDKKAVKEGAGPYTLDDPKHPKFKANFEKFKKKNPDAKLADFVAAMRKKEKGLAEGAYDEPEAPNADAIAKRKRLQAIKDRQEDERAMGGKDETNTPIRKVPGKAYGGAAQKNEPEVDEGTIAKPKKDLRKHSATAKRMAMQKKADKGHEEWLDNLEKTDPDHPSLKYRKQAQLGEVAPPGAKAERMVKHIKKGYANDGKLTKKEKGIAYATAWKAHNKGQVEEGVEFKDAGKIKNSAPNMKKAKPAKLKESKVMEETDYFYEKVGKALAEKNPHLDTASSDFVGAVRKEMIAQGIEPNRARGILLMDEDFISDVADSYGHYCELVDTHHPLPAEIDLGGMKELDEIARLAGLPVRETEVYDQVNHEQVEDSMDEDALGAVMGGIAGGMIGKTPGAVATGAKLGSAARDTFNSATGLDEVDDLDEVTAPPRAIPGKAPAAKATGMAPAKGNVPPTPTFNEDEVEEGNEFSGALAKAKASGAKEFEVDGKKYTVKEGTSVNDIRRLSGLAETEEVVEEDEELSEERDIEYVNTPREKTAPLSAAIPSGTDLHKSKMQDPETANKAANPLTRKAKQVEESLWNSYEDMINDVKAK